MESSWQQNHWQRTDELPAYELSLIKLIICTSSFVMAVANYALFFITNCLFVIKVIIHFYVEKVNLYKNIFWCLICEFLTHLTQGACEQFLSKCVCYPWCKLFLWTPLNLHFNQSLEKLPSNMSAITKNRNTGIYLSIFESIWPISTWIQVLVLFKTYVQQISPPSKMADVSKNWNFLK